MALLLLLPKKARDVLLLEVERGAGEKAFTLPAREVRITAVVDSFIVLLVRWSWMC